MAGFGLYLVNPLLVVALTLIANDRQAVITKFFFGGNFKSFLRKFVV